jgi:hypothetical protein
MVKRYTDAMRRVYKHYKRTYGVDKNTLYLFFIDYPEADKKGFMPLTGRYGFIFNFGMDYEIMAHELAHGAFNLRHPFSPESTYQLTEGTTDNLMDYGKPQGTGLWKYQWDLIHDPERVLFAWTEDEDEGAYIDLRCSNIDISDYPEGHFKDVPYNMERLIGFIEDNSLWANKFTEDILADVRNQIMDEYYFSKRPNSNVYSFNEDLMATDSYVPSADEWKKKKDHFDLLYQSWDCLFFESTRAKACGKYDEAITQSQRTSEVKQLTNHFVGIPEDFIWLDGTKRDIPDPRKYYNSTLKKYNLEALKKDLRKAVINKNQELVSGELEKATNLELNYQALLSRYGEYMYTIGCNEIPEITTAQKNKIKQEFFNLWSSEDKLGFHWKWYTLKQDRLEREKQKLLDRLAAERAVRLYLNQKERDAVYAMVGGGVGVASGVLLMIVFPPSTIAGVIWGIADLGITAASFAEGYNMYKDIQANAFDPNRKYNVVEGVCYNLSEEHGALIFDLSSIVLGVRSASGNFRNIRNIESISGNELKVIITGINGGLTAVTVGDKTFTLLND